MHQTLNTPFADTRAGELRWSLDRAALPALLSRTCEVGGHTLELRVLGASHQVRLGTAAGAVTETVACVPGLAGDLPELAAPTVPGLADYTFTSAVSVLDPAAFAAEVARIRAATARDPHGLVASFPGSPHALTVLRCEPAGESGLRWHTWHTYPQTGELVATTTTCEPAGPVRGPRTRGAGP
ncbi:MAG: DUF2617 family protein [Nocardiopsaceae bacterium]|nr:DUF2617 family protein [Nocardiopsaceae bacterium]